MRTSFLSSGLTVTAGFGTSTSTVEPSRSTIRTGPSCSSRSLIVRFVCEHQSGEARDPALASPRAQYVEEQRANAPALPVVGDRQGELGDLGSPRIAYVARQADRLSGELIDGDHRLAVVVVELGQVAERRSRQLPDARQEPAVARLRAEAIEGAQQEIGVRTVPLPDAHA